MGFTAKLYVLRFVLSGFVGQRRTKHNPPKAFKAAPRFGERNSFPKAWPP